MDKSHRYLFDAHEPRTLTEYAVCLDAAEEDHAILTVATAALHSALHDCMLEIDAAYCGINTLPADHSAQMAYEKARKAMAGGFLPRCAL